MQLVLILSARMIQACFILEAFIVGCAGPFLL
jgi:hypothetical protein